jgi:amidohydrolase
LLLELTPKFPGLVKLLFQPAEETVGGAKLLIAAGVLEKPKVEAIFGLHVEPALDVGQVELRYGQRNASSDTITLTIHGRAGHGAYPADSVDAIMVAAQVLSALQTIVSRNVDARDSAVLSFGRIEGGSQGNIVADRVRLVGTVRTLDPAIRKTVLGRLVECAEGIAAALGGRAEVEIEAGYDPLINDDRMVDVVRANARRLVGEENIRVNRQPNMGVEDFAYYLSHAPGAFYSLGVRNEARGIVHSVHNDRFDADEECLAYGATLQVANALSILES